MKLGRQLAMHLGSVGSQASFDDGQSFLGRLREVQEEPEFPRYLALAPACAVEPILPDSKPKFLRARHRRIE
jgi:hypothetical protein